MTRLIATVRAYFFGVLSTLYHGTRVTVCAWLKCSRREHICWTTPRAWAGSMLWAAGVKVEVQGLEHLDPPRPAVLVSNHQSWFDVFALAAKLPVDFRFVGKRELTRIPFFGSAWIACGNIAIDRRDRTSAIRSLAEAGKRLSDDKALVIMFPEGTRSRDGELLPFKKGAFVLALQLGVPVIPVTIAGTRAIMPKGAWSVRPGTVQVRIGAPIDVSGLTEADRDALLQTTRERIVAMREPRLPGDAPPELDAQTRKPL